jgi:CheY-like chemotaxis protein
MVAKTPRILLVDSDPTDVEATQEAFRQVGLQAHFFIALSGDEARALLAREGAYADVPAPDFIIIDLQLRGFSGRDLISFIKRDARLRRIPVVVLATSDRQQDIEACYALFANTYIVRPPEWDRFLERIRALEHYWFRTASLPG